MLKNIEVVSFDFHGTLVSKYPLLVFYYVVIPEVLSETKGIEYSKEASIVTTEYAKLGPWNPKWHDPFFWLEKFEIKIPLEKLVERSLEISSAEILEENIPEVLRKIKQRFKVIIFTTPPKAFVKMKMKDLEEVLRDVEIISAVEDLGMPKTPEAYKLVAKKLGVEPSKILHIGDSTKEDYFASIEAGWNALLYDPKNRHPEIPKRISSFNELYEILLANKF